MIHRTMPDIHKMHRIPCRMHTLSHRIATFDRESNHRGAERPCGARPNAAPLLSLSNVAILWLRTCAFCVEFCAFCVCLAWICGSCVYFLHLQG